MNNKRGNDEKFPINFKEFAGDEKEKSSAPEKKSRAADFLSMNSTAVDCARALAAPCWIRRPAADLARYELGPEEAV